ncbi:MULTISPECIES: FecR family protein [Dyadobacter]|uniref:FecR domain-containing protein n=1 Tax=Dyadobacter chenhuakuii TaxID=2909339 RepID=A0ABY4XG12_9BACT|nr:MULTISPECIES: FecR domain-containing protein [Dyadobacter]MCE7069591.1 FecR domain-containing protein [Dyadobacter sp. CY327]MCF2491916.1 FecR domain-containing protein [Dyadobacter chenhuakuii]MCF2516553.1 FecR domain-containing protein [Dyadobacter sp. CY351]USJ28922.1 FecR domain-containing protein [Dyadobacter chenhuakuii]
MDHYRDFTVEDFVWDNVFRQWVLSPTRETDELWEAWIEKNADAHDKIQQAKSIVLSLRLHEPELSDPEITEIVKNTIGRIDGFEKYPTFAEPVKQLKTYHFPWFRMAAAVALLLISGWIIYSLSTKKESRQITFEKPIQEDKDSITEKWNASTKPMTVVLDDGSKVTLSAKARIRYANKFVAAKREVYLEGEAFFDITKDADRPFFVYSNGLVTKVLGTSFTIRAYGNSNEVTVEVKTGRVSVFPQSDPDFEQKTSGRELQGIVLSPNQKIIYSREEVRMVKTLVEKPEIVVPKAEIPQFEFEDTPASDVFATVGKAYGIEILYDAEILKDCPLTATLDNQTLHEKLFIICQAVEASYEIIDGQVVIHSRGCKN